MRRLALLLLLVPTLAQAGVQARLKLVSDVPEMSGKQVQNPVWGPGGAPHLVHEMTDRDKSTLLRIVTVEGEGFGETPIPGARSSRLESLGAGAVRADTRAAWWDEGSLFFVRSLGGGSSLIYFDGVPRELSGLPGRPAEVVADPERGQIYVGLEDEGGFDLHRFGGQGFTKTRTRLTRTAHEVENALSLEPKSGRMHFVRTSQERTALGWVDPAALSAELGASSTALAAYELLSLRAVPGSTDLLLYARVPAGAPDEGASHVLLELAGGKLSVLAPGVFLPPGMVPAPAISDGGRYVYYVLNDAAGGNPVRRLDRSTRKSEAIELGTRGNQEVAVQDYADGGGTLVPWIAVVAVGDEDGDDVRNHLYVGPLGPWKGWGGK